MAKRRPRRIRCHCCNWLMSYVPYKPGDAVRRKLPHAGMCIDCRPLRPKERLWARSSKEHVPFCSKRGCEPASAIDRLAVYADD